MPSITTASRTRFTKHLPGEFADDARSTGVGGKIVPVLSPVGKEDTTDSLWIDPWGLSAGFRTPVVGESFKSRHG
jgi:hypothetical protein